MPTPITIPHFKATHADAVLALWLKDAGDLVERDEVLCQITIDKVTIDIAAPVAGVLRRVLAQVGEYLPSGELIGVIGSADEVIADADFSRQHPVRTCDYCPLPARPDEDPAEVDVRDGEPQPLEPMRYVVARRMTVSKQSAPHFYVTTTIDMTAAVALRKTLKQEKIRATYNDMLIKASGMALRKIPEVAAIYTPQGIVPRERMNVGFACAVDAAGLVVPVLREVDTMSLAEVAAATKELASRARDHKLYPHEYAGGVFSITNLGTYAVDEFGAIINPGEAAILAAGKVDERPWVIKGELCVRPIMKITLSSDHRVINGALAAKFNGCVKNFLEKPEQLR